MGRGIKHSHTHPNATVTSSTKGWDGYFFLSWHIQYEHDHSVDMLEANAHSHANVVLAFGSAPLGSPNWWEHTHPITLVSMGSAGASHTHTLGNMSLSECIIAGEPCGVYHNHGLGSPTQGAAGAAHTHSIYATQTGYADPAGTPENHVHPFTVTFQAQTASHSLSGNCASAYCASPYIGSHNHSYPASGSCGNDHTASGNTGAGGEPLPAVVRVGYMDGFVLIA